MSERDEITRETYRHCGTGPDDDLLGNIHHLLAPVIGQLRYAAHLGETLSPEQMERYANRLMLAMHVTDRHLGGDQVLGSVGGVIVGDRVRVTGDMELVGTVVGLVNVEHRAIGSGLNQLDVHDEATGTIVRVPMQSFDGPRVRVQVVIPGKPDASVSPRTVEGS